MRVSTKIFPLLLVPAVAFGAASREPARGRLPVTNPLQVEAHSWNGRRAPAPVTPAPATNVRWGRNYRPDPMRVVITGAQPRTKWSFLRQKQSKNVVIPGKVGDLTDLEALAGEVAEYVEMVSAETDAPNPTIASAHRTEEPARVAWPNSRALLRATTHDGQRYQDVPLIVQGQRSVNVVHLNDVTGGVDNLQLSGRLLPSARAWLKPANIFVSEPASRPEMVAEGKALDREADKEQRELDGIQERIDAYIQKSPRPADFNEKYQAMLTRQRELPNLIAQKRADATNKISKGSKLMVQVVSVGGTPAQTPIRTTNPRITQQGGDTIHTAHDTSKPVHGFVAQEVEAIEGDDLEMEATFGGAGEALSSTARTTFRVPAADAKPAFVMGGIKYYSIGTPRVTEHHDADPEPNQ